MKGVAWDGVGAPQLESAKKATELISEVSTFHFLQKFSYNYNCCSSLVIIFKSM